MIFCQAVAVVLKSDFSDFISFKILELHSNGLEIVENWKYFFSFDRNSQ